MRKENIDWVVKSGLCLGCGICQDACPSNCIKILHGSKSIRPVIDSNRCIECGICTQTCPGRGLKLKNFASKLYNVEHDRYIGPYYKSYTGWSCDDMIRFHSASGGVVTQFLLYLLHHKYMDGVAVVGFDDKNKMLSHSYIARTEKDIINARSSKYCTTSIEGIATEIKNNPGRYIIVGLPCHIQAFRLFEEKFKVVKDSIVGHFSIYCSLNKINISTKYYCNRYKVLYEQIRKFSYRDDGCMGYMKFECYDESEKKIPYIHYWLGTHSFFVNKRCLLCNDHFGELADISFGDINIAPYNADKIGISSIVTKTPFWDNILTNAANDGYIELHDLPKDVLLSSQKYVIIHKKGAGISAMRNIRRWFGLKNPIHDDQIQKATFKMYIKQFASLLMMEVGKRPYLWFIIKILDRYK